MNRLVHATSALLRRCALAWLLLGSALSLTAIAQELAAVPALSERVIDRTGTLTAEQRQAMVQHLADVEREIGSQIVVLIVPSTLPEDIAAYAQRVGDQWKLGRREVGDGLLIVVAKDDRKVRIEVAKALEGAVPDLAARQIITETITPAFRRGDYAGGLNAAIDRIAARIRPEGLPAPGESGRRGATRDSSGGLGLDWEQLAMFFFVGVPVVGALLTGMLGRKLGALATGGAAGGIAWLLSASLLIAGIAGVLALIMVGVFGFGAGGRGRGGGPPIIWGGGGGGGGWGGGGGGFSSGGGGDFGGGGASGDW